MGTNNRPSNNPSPVDDQISNAKNEACKECQNLKGAVSSSALFRIEHPNDRKALSRTPVKPEFLTALPSQKVKELILSVFENNPKLINKMSGKIVFYLEDLSRSNASKEINRNVGLLLLSGKLDKLAFKLISDALYNASNKGATNDNKQ